MEKIIYPKTGLLTVKGFITFYSCNPITGLKFIIIQALMQKKKIKLASSVYLKNERQIL